MPRDLSQGQDLAVPGNITDILPTPDVRQLQSTQSSDNATDEGQNPTSFAEALQANSPFNNERLFYSGIGYHCTALKLVLIQFKGTGKAWFILSWTFAQAKDP